MASTRWRGSLMLGLLGALATTACGGGGPEIQQFDGEPPIFTYHGDGEMQALVHGRLAYLDDERCIVLERAVGHELAVFPDGSDAYLEPDGTLIVETRDFGPLREGVSITAGGGHLSSDQGADRPAIPSGCSSDGISFAVLQRITDVR